MSGPSFSTLLLVCLLLGLNTPVMADIVVQAKDSLGFEPQNDQNQGAGQTEPKPQVTSSNSPTTPTVQQDAPTTPAVATPTMPTQSIAKPPAPLPTMIQMQASPPILQNSGGGGSAPNSDSARQVLQNMMNSFARPDSTRFPMSGDALTEGSFSYGGYCPNGQCYKGARNSGFRGIDPDKMSFGSTGNACRDRILKNAREVAAKYRHSRRAFKGKCALAVRTALQNANLNKIGALGDAKDMGPNLKRLGFVNKMTSSNPDDAPEGAILVYGPANKPFCAGLGSLYGHVEVKDFNGLFHYDGTATHNIQKRFGSDCRPLIGVYLPGPELEKSC